MAAKLEDRYAFVVEWFDQSAQMAKEFRLFFYADDNSVEMYDPKQRRTFLKRSKYPSIHLEDFYVGSAVNVFSRQLTIKAFADEITQEKIAKKMEKAVVLVPSSLLASMGKIMDAIYKDHFTIARLRMIRLDISNVQKFVDLQRKDPVGQWKDVLVGRVLVIEVAKTNAVAGLHTFAERTGIPSGVYFSRCPAAAELEIEFFFGPHTNTEFPRTAHFQNSTLAVIKPHVLNKATKTGSPGKIVDGILKAGFEITDMQLFHLDRVNAEEFYEVYKTVVPEFHLMVDELITGPCIAMEICPGRVQLSPQQYPDSTHQLNNIVAAFRHFVGPFDPEIGRRIRPESLRAMFGEDKVRNAIHCTDLVEDSELEVRLSDHGLG